MKKYFKIVNRVIVFFCIAFILSFYEASSIMAQMNDPMFDRGDGYGVIPGKKLSPTTYKYLKETEEVLKKFNDLRLDVDSPTPTPTKPQLPISDPQSSSFPLPTLSPNTPLSPIPPNSSIETISTEIKNSIHGSCREFGAGIIKKSNNSCVDVLNPILTDRATRTIKELKDSTSAVNIPGSPYHQTVQCVGCARALSEAIGKSYRGFGAAKQHIGKAVTGYNYVTNTSLTPQSRASSIPPGSLFVTTDGTFGHIGMVKKVNISNLTREALSFVAVECNWEKPGYFGERVIHFDQVAGFQVPQI
jgi:surface antigen